MSVIQLDKDWINGPFQDILVSFNSLIKYNNVSVPVLGPYTEEVFKSLRNLSYLFQDQFNILTYNPFYSDPDLYFCNNQIYVNSDKMTFSTVIQYKKTLDDLDNVTDYLVENNYVNNEVTNLQNLSARMKFILDIFANPIIDGRGICDPDTAGIQIGYYGTTLYGNCFPTIAI